MLSAQTTLLNPSRSTSTSILKTTSHLPTRRSRATQNLNFRPRYVPGYRKVRAVIEEEKNTSRTFTLPAKELLRDEAVEVSATVTIRKKMKEKLLDRMEETWDSCLNAFGLGIVIQLVSEEIDPVTKKEKRSVEAPVRGWLPKDSGDPYLHEYTANFTVASGFGKPGAILVTNPHDREFYLTSIVVRTSQDDETVFFHANTWIHPKSFSSESRIIFSNKAFLPSQTPTGLEDLRKKELENLRGDGKDERQTYDRIYDYDVYNDLGKPDKDDDLARPTLGGEMRPYPRRCRTGRRPCRSDPSCESRIEKPNPVYVPRDETFEEVKQKTFSAGAFKATLHNLIPALTAALSKSDRQFKNFSDIDDLYKEGVMLNQDVHLFFENLLIPTVVRKVMNLGQKLMKYEIPSIISRDRFSWLRDHEFARQTLAGVNPVCIERLREFPIMSKLDPEIYGAPQSAITKEILEESMNGMTVEEAIEDNKLFILDFHDILLPFVDKINSQEDRKSYASRTVFFYTSAGTLKPIAIELSQPPTSSEPRRKKVYSEGHCATSTWIWKLAKAHVCSNDAGVHQLVSHWLRTHACMEAYVIASHRRLSAMHPIFKLLHPHMRYTLEINALARQSLINGGGIIESCFSPGKFCMEVSSAAYESWRFDMEALPADLLRRGMAVEDPSKPCGVRLVIEDYPYAADGLLVWSAIEDWVTTYTSHFYPTPAAVAGDTELQSWWSEIKTHGHADKCNEPWWPALDTPSDLAKILTTMIWTASGQHAAINFGQYPFGGYVPNRPTVMKKLVPDESDDSFLHSPESAFLSALPSQLQATKVMAVQDTLSTHAPDEEYIGGAQGRWIDDAAVVKSYKRFSERLSYVEQVIQRRNRDRKLVNRNGAGVPPYELLIPSSDPGVTGRGVPNSISI